MADDDRAFLLNAVDQFDSRTFDLLGPEIAHSFHINVGKFGVIRPSSACGSPSHCSCSSAPWEPNTAKLPR